MRERALDALWRDFVAAAAMLAFCTLVGGIVSLLHGWVMYPSGLTDAQSLAVAAVLSLADGRA